MAKKITPPNFNEGWAYFPGASKFEIKTDATGHYSAGTVRQFGNKKIVEHDEHGIVRLYDDEKVLRDFKPMDVLKEMMESKKSPIVAPVEKKKPSKKTTTSPDESFPSMNVVVGGNDNDDARDDVIIENPKTEVQTTKQQQPITTDTMAKKTTTPKKAASKKKPAPAKKSGAAKTKRTGLPLLADLKVTKEEEKIAKLKTQYSIKAWKLHKNGRTVKEIMVILNRPDKHTSTPMGIDRYKASKKLQDKADAVKVD